ncbi:rod shape-determining protein RodA [Clostridia bacterium]|nr:rod shape-determining protein RodA [Clostridia bacterium]
MAEKKQFKDLDILYLVMLLLILVISGVIQATASFGVKPSEPYYYLQRHLFSIGTGLILFAIIAIINYREYRTYSRLIYAGMLLILILVLIPGIGAIRNNARSWFILGPLSLQPAEVAKVLFIILFADFLDKRKNHLETLVQLIPCFLYLAVPVGLILMQPDMGTSLVFFAITFFMLFAAGANPKILFGLLGLGIGSVVLLLVMHYQMGMPLPLEDYQLMRFTVFLNPYNDGKGGLGAGYNIIQSLIAIGSGGLFGKGFMQGTQSQSNFLPFHHTDFVFAVIGEEFGFIGSIVVLGCFLFLMYRALMIARKSLDLYGALIISGVVGMMFFHIVESAGMAIGVMPITGIPFPILSSGGSSMWANMAALGLIVSVDLHKKTIRF